MRKVVAASTTLTVAMYQDTKTRNTTWADLHRQADTQATTGGYTPLRPGSWFASVTFYRHDGDTIAACDADQAEYVRLTAEITCEDTHAENR